MQCERWHEMEGVIVPKANFTQLKKLFQQIAADKRSNAVLRRETQ